jgi:hypothetical protein
LPVTLSLKGARQTPNPMAADPHHLKMLPMRALTGRLINGQEGL